MTAIPQPARTVALRPLALPAEHGGWGFLLEPIALGLLVQSSWTGGLIGIAALFGFLTRQPLKLALQDALRSRVYPRTPYCWLIVASYLVVAAVALSTVIAVEGVVILIPLALAAPLALTQIAYDAWGRSRELLPEMTGAAAMASIAGSVTVAGGMGIVPALGLSAILAARSLPSILYVRALLRPGRRWPAIAAHVVVLAAVAFFAGPLTIAAMLVLLLRAVWGVTQERPRAKTVGWREVGYGALTVILIAADSAGLLLSR
jgi:hypothetical protein